MCTDDRRAEYNLPGSTRRTCFLVNQYQVQYFPAVTAFLQIDMCVEV